MCQNPQAVLETLGRESIRQHRRLLITGQKVADMLEDGTICTEIGAAFMMKLSEIAGNARMFQEMIFEYAQSHNVEPSEELTEMAVDLIRDTETELKKLLTKRDQHHFTQFMRKNFGQRGPSAN